MKTKIEEVQQYFKNKLLAGEYTAEDFNDGYFTAIVDNEYEFKIWHGNDGRYCKSWNSIGNFFMQLPEFTKEESAEMWGNASKIIAENSERIRLEKIEKLTEELNKLKS